MRQAYLTWKTHRIIANDPSMPMRVRNKSYEIYKFIEQTEIQRQISKKPRETEKQRAEAIAEAAYCRLLKYTIRKEMGEQAWDSWQTQLANEEKFPSNRDEK